MMKEMCLSIIMSGAWASNALLLVGHIAPTPFLTSTTDIFPYILLLLYALISLDRVYLLQNCMFLF